MSRLGRALCALVALTLVPAAAGAFTIKGRVVNGTTRDRNVSTDVVIVNPSGGMMAEETVRAENGTFVADNLSDDASVFLVRVDYQGVMYSEMVRVAEGDPADVVVMIYESTDAWEGVRVSISDMVARRHEDHLEIEQLYEVNNVSNPPRAIVGDGPFRFPVPADNQGIESVYVTALGMPIQRPAAPTDTPDLYRVDYAIRPGITRVAVSYTVPYTDAAYTLREVFPYDLDEIVVFGEDPDMSIAGGTVDFQRGEADNNMVAYSAGPLEAGAPLEIRFAGGSGRSLAGSGNGGSGGGGGGSRGTVLILPNPMEEASLMIMVILLLALTAFMGITLHGTRDPLSDPANLRNYYDTLLRRMARLDDMLAAHTIPAEVHRAKREELKTQLGSLMRLIREREGRGGDESSGTHEHPDRESASAP